MQKSEQSTKAIFRGIFSIILGIIAGIATFFILIMIFMALGTFGWSDGGEEDYLQRLDKSTNITLMISVIMAVIVFIVVIIRFNRKNSNT